MIHYPQVLDDQALQIAREIAFCSTCECGVVHFVVIWPGDRARIMASDDVGLYERFEAQDWPESVHADENRLFTYRTVPHPLDITLFLKG